MNDQLADRIHSTANCVVYLNPVKSGTDEKSLADLLWRTCGVAFSEKDISVRINEKTGEGNPLLLCDRKTVATWLHACLSPTLGMTVSPAEFGTARPGAHQDRRNDRLNNTKVITNRLGIPRLVTLGKDKR